MDVGAKASAHGSPTSPRIANPPDLPYDPPVPLGPARAAECWPHVVLGEFEPRTARLILDALSFLDVGLRFAAPAMSEELARTKVVSLTKDRFPSIDPSTALAAWNWSSRELGLNGPLLFRIGNPIVVGAMGLHELFHVRLQSGPGETLRDKFVNEVNAHSATGRTLFEFRDNVAKWNPPTVRAGEFWKHEFNRYGYHEVMDAAMYGFLIAVDTATDALLPKWSGISNDPATRGMGNCLATCLQYGKVRAEVILKAVDGAYRIVTEQLLRKYVTFEPALVDQVRLHYATLQAAKAEYAAIPVQCD